MSRSPARVPVLFLLCVWPMSGRRASKLATALRPLRLDDRRVGASSLDVDALVDELLGDDVAVRVEAALVEALEELDLGAAAAGAVLLDRHHAPVLEVLGVGA